MLFIVETVSTLVPGLPLEQVTLLVLREMKGPLLEAPEMLALRLIVPENPFSDVSVIVDVPDDPRAMLREEAEAVKLKSLKVNVTVSVWVREPLVAVTVTE